MSITPTGGPTITVTVGQLESIGKENLQFERAEDKQLFLGLVNKAYAEGAGSEIALDIPRPLNAGELGLVPLDRDRYDSILSSASDVLLVLRRLGADMEASSRQAKHAARQGEYDTMINAAQKIREAAGAEFACAIIAGLIQIGGGILAAKGSMKAMDVGLKPYNIGAPKAAVPGAAGTTTPSAATPGATGTPGAWQKATNPSIASQAGGPGAPPASPPPRVQIGSERVAPAPAAKPNPGGLEAAPKQVARPDGPLQADAVTTTGRTRSNAVSGDQHRPQQQQPAADGPEISPQQRMAIDKANIEAQAIQGKWNAVLQIAMGASAMANATGGLASKLIEADKAVLDADAKQWGYKVDDAKDSQDRFHQLKDEMQRMLGEIGRSEYEMNKQIWS